MGELELSKIQPLNLDTLIGEKEEMANSNNIHQVSVLC